MRWLRSIHAYAGLVLGILLAVFTVTGGILVFKDEIWRLQYPELTEPLRVLTVEEHVAAFRRAAELFGGDISTIKVPTDSVPAYHVYTNDGEALLAQTDHAVIDRWRAYQSFTGILTELHFRLAAGEVGKQLAGWIAIFCVLMGFSGIVIWWPGRRSYAWTHLVPRSTRRIALLRMHRDTGIVFVAALVLFAITAAGVIFYPAARQALNYVFSDRPPEQVERFSVATGSLPQAPDEKQLALALSVFSEARFVAYYPPKVGRPAHYFRFKLPAERHPNGRSAVYIDPDSAELMQSIDASQQPAGERIGHWLYPLHAARIGGPLYTLFATLSALALSAIALTGPIVYLQRSRRPRPPER